ncbi:MAG: AMP-dependent synthetase/ligase [Micromonosporaceae bacterium]
MVAATLTDVRSLAESFQQTAAKHPDAVALRTTGGAVEITWREYAERVRRIAAALAALGITRGDTVGLMLTNRPECDLVDTAAIHLGAIPFSIYNTSSPEQISYLFSNAENQVVVTESAFLPQVRAATGTSVRHVISVDGEAEGVRSLADLESTEHPDFDFDAAWRAVRPDDVATLIYTSGTTGPPKGVELSHANILAEVAGVLDNIPLDHADSTVSFLPTAHIADRVTGHYLNLTAGLRVTAVSDPKAVAAALPDARPSVFFGVPRVWQKIKAGIEAKLAAEPDDRKRKVASWAIGVGRETARRDLAGEPRGLLLDLKHWIADRLVLAKVRHALGMDRMRWPASGAASIPVDTLEFFFGIGVPIYEVWGMSETTGAATANAPGKTRLGTVGKPGLGVECTLAEDGELLCRGEIVMRGYRKDPERTSEAVDDDGWVHTGDIATIDDDGYVTIIDRKKELIISEGGKNMSPSNIENAIKSASPLVGQVVAVGDNRPYVTALIVLDPDAAVPYAEKLELAADTSPAVLAEHPALRETIADAVRSGNQALSRTEQIKRFQILAHVWDPGGDELTPTLKLKRRPIAEKYATEIEQLYEPSPGPAVVNLS